MGAENFHNFSKKKRNLLLKKVIKSKLNYFNITSSDLIKPSNDINLS